MPTFTPNYNLAKPLVNSAVDQDLWGNELNGDMDILDTTLKSLQDQITAISSSVQLPIGSIYTNFSDNTDPASLLGYGTWIALKDRFLIGAGGVYSAGSTGGATTHTLTAAEIPPLSYTVSLNNGANSATGARISNSGATNNAETSSASSAIATNAGGGAHSILNPYVAVYMWYRSA